MNIIAYEELNSLWNFSLCKEYTTLLTLDFKLFLLRYFKIF